MRSTVASRLGVGLTAVAVTIGVLASAAPTAHAWANGNTAPVKALQGPNTNLASVMDVLVDSAGRTYVLKSSSILVFAPDWASGNTSPIDTFNTGLGVGLAMAFDAQGRLYVADAAGNSITVFEADWFEGSRTPLKTLSGVSTGLNWPSGIAFDSGGAMYVSNGDGNSVTVYSNGWATGNTAPVKTLSGASTLLNNPLGIAIDSHDNLYVTNANGRNVTSYAAGWAGGDTAPTKIAVNSAVSGFQPTALEFDSAGRMLVAAFGNDEIDVYAAGWSNGAEPIRTLAGPATGLDNPSGLAFDASGQLFVSNYLAASITVYSPTPVPPGAPTRVTASRGNASAVVTWRAPALDGGAPITSYEVIPSSGQSRCTWTSGPLTCTVTGLTNGAAYTFTVVATNEAGDSVASLPSRAVKPLPPSPTITQASPSSLKAGTPKRIAITGSGFISGQMFVGLQTTNRKVACSNVTVVSSSSLTCLAPKLAAGTYSVVVGFTNYPVAAARKLGAVTVKP